MKRFENSSIDDLVVRGLYAHKGLDELARDIVDEERPYDPVEHPSHYTGDKMECIEGMEMCFGAPSTFWFCICNAFKYLWRFKKKNGIEDIRKAHWYLTKCLALFDNETAQGRAINLNTGGN